MASDQGPDVPAYVDVSDDPPFVITRRPTPPWPAYRDGQTLNIPLTPIRDARFDLIERAQKLFTEAKE